MVKFNWKEIEIRSKLWSTIQFLSSDSIRIGPKSMIEFRRLGIQILNDLICRPASPELTHLCFCVSFEEEVNKLDHKRESFFPLENFLQKNKNCFINDESWQKLVHLSALLHWMKSKLCIKMTQLSLWWIPFVEILSNKKSLTLKSEEYSAKLWHFKKDNSTWVVKF